MAVTLTKENVEDHLRNLLESEDDPTDVPQLCSDLELSISLNPGVVPLVGELVAALASEESFREQAGKSNVLATMVPFLSAPDLSTRLQVMRAVGNMCIDNDSNRGIVLEADGCQGLVAQMSKCCDPNAEEFANERFKCVVCGCTVNVAADNESLAQGFATQGAHEEISSLISISEQSEKVVEFGLQALQVIAENANLEDTKTSSFVSAVVQLLRTSEDEILKLALELVKAIIEKGDVLAVELVKLGIVQQLCRIQQPDLQQQALDLLTLLLGKDKCMEAIFGDGETVPLMKTWLKEPPTPLHMANAALVVANMARSDSNCAYLVKNGFVPVLIAAVNQKETEQVEGKLHHSALSALRNLSLPAEHKKEFFTMGVVDCAVNTLRTSTHSHVQFKAVGILRLLADNQAPTCSYIIEEAMEALMRVCAESGIAHVHIEAGRLLAAVVKHCQNKDVIIKLASEGGLKWIYHLMQCEQPQVIAEGLMAINIILVQHPGSLTVFSSEASSSLVTTLCSILTSSFPPNLVNNSLVLIKTLLSTESDLKSLLKNSADLQQALQRHLSHENVEIKLKTKEVLELLS